MIRHLHHKAMTEVCANLQAVFAKPDDPGVPAEADLVFMCDVLHHIPDRPAWLAKLAAQMHKARGWRGRVQGRQAARGSAER